MRSFALAATLSAALFTAGPVLRPEPPWGAPASQKLAREAYAARDRGDYDLADALLNRGLEACARARQNRAALRFRLASASARYAAGRFQAAGTAYLAAEDEAGRLGDIESLVAIRTNLASLYAYFGDRTSARRTAESGLAAAGGRDVYSRPHLQVLLATLCLEDGDWGRATALARDALSNPHTVDEAFRAVAWDTLGDALLAGGRLDDAESALVQSFVVRRLGASNAGTTLSASYAYLAKLRLAQHRPHDVLRFASLALQEGHPDVSPLYSPYYLRGRAHLELGNSETALTEFGAALDFYSAWRSRALPADSLRAYSNAALQDLTAAYASTAADLFVRTGLGRYAKLAWEADESHRAASLREGAAWKWRDRVPPEYWQKLARLRTLMLRADSENTETAPAIASLNSDLLGMEARAGLTAAPSSITQQFRESIPSGNTLLLLQRQLGPGRAVVSFRLGERRSFRWTVTNRGFQASVIAPRSTVQDIALQFEAAVRSGRSGDASGRALFDALFSGLSDDVETADHWLIEPDGELFRTPLSAVPLPGGAYLGERRALSTYPGAWAIGPTRQAVGRFAAIADPVYNRADPRLAAAPLASIFARPDRVPELPRLPGSRAESEGCARAYGAADPLILTGPEASRPGIERILRAKPAVLHFATHLQFDKSAQEPVLVLSRTYTAIDGMTARDIAALDVPGSLVVMSGCASADAATLPGDGLLGLSRAWLSAGARAVIATHWPVPDDAGALFRSFYRHVSESGDPAGALRDARIDMLRDGGARSNPSYWAAYELLERNN